MRTTTVVIGAGHAGLSMSRCLRDRAIDHVVLERGEIANSWKKERWDSLRLLTPNWQSRLPGYAYDGEDPDGYRTMPETIRFIEGYAASFDAPVRAGTTVAAVRARDAGYEIETDQGTWHCASVVIASGACSVARVPAMNGDTPTSIDMLSTAQYRNPDQIADGGVLVVGASASGTQIADELQRSGRAVTLAVGEHIRAPRVYRGRDLEWWMEESGVLDQRYDEVDDLVRARSVPSLQLAGSPERRTLDLNALTDQGVRLVGRLVAFRGTKALFAGSLKNMCALSDLKMNRLLGTLDEWAEEQGLDDGFDPPERFEPTRVEENPPLELDLASEKIRTIVWATGFRPDHSFVDLPVFDRKGTDASRRRRRRRARSLPARHAVSAAAEVEPDRRGRARRAGSVGPPERLSRRAQSDER